MTNQLTLLPFPRHLEQTQGQFELLSHGRIVLDGPDSQALFSIARSLQATLTRNAKREWGIVSGKHAAGKDPAMVLMVVPGSMPHSQGYAITITTERVEIVAEQPVGIFYAVQTLCQIMEQCGSTLPVMHVRDWPDFPNRGVMLDISRDKVPSMDTLYQLVELLASWKINQVQLYTEHTFAFHDHREVWEQASPMTGEEILALDTYCRERFIELVPNQNTFGHMNRWLKHDRYRSLAEAPDGCDTHWGHFNDPFSLNPGDPASLELVRELLDELLPHFSSQQINVGCDETVDLGMGRSKEIVEKLGVGRVYLDFLMKIYNEVKSRRYTMQYWGDIIMEHPELTPELPRDAIALEWGYEADHPFDDHGNAFAASGIPFYVCPGTSSWNTIAGRTDNAMGNLRNAALNGLKHGAVGYLITDWGDNGHWQPLPVSYLGFAYGAGLSWGYETNMNTDIQRVLDVLVFRDSGQVMGRLAYELGNVYQIPEIPIPNNSILFYLLQTNMDAIRGYLSVLGDLEPIAAGFQSTYNRIDEIMEDLTRAKMLCADAGLIQQEFSWAADMLRHACRRARWGIGKAQSKDEDALGAQLMHEAENLIGRYREIWHARNRPGGFQDSVKRMDAIRWVQPG
jgi:hexosaminidase